MLYCFCECSPRKWDTSIQCEYITCNSKNNARFYARYSSVISCLNKIKFAVQVPIYQGKTIHTRFKVYNNYCTRDTIQLCIYILWQAFASVHTKRKKISDFLKACLQIWHREYRMHLGIKFGLNASKIGRVITDFSQKLNQYFMSPTGQSGYGNKMKIGK